MQLIVEQGNDYLVGVKGNQPKLLQQFKTAALEQLPRSIDIQSERTRERVVERTVKVFEANCALTSDWAKAQSLIEVQRQGTGAGEPFEATSYYLSSLSVEAVEFGLGIRCHRDIENGLHWVKDVVLKEDALPFSMPPPLLTGRLFAPLSLTSSVTGVIALCPKPNVFSAMTSTNFFIS